MEHKATYLEVAIHDQDFYYPIVESCHLFYDTCKSWGHYPKEEDMPLVKESLKHMIYGAYVAEVACRECKRISVSVDYLEPRLRFVDFSEITEYRNSDYVYIPMFDCGSVFVRQENI